MAERSPIPAPPSSDASASPVATTNDPNKRAEMDSQNMKLLSMLLPKLPLIVRVAVLHVLHLSESAKYLDLRSTLVIAVLRSFLEPSPSKPRTISAIQKLTLKDPGIKGRIWVSTYTSPVPPEMDARDALLTALDDLRDHSLPEPRFRKPDLVDVEAEWTGYRAFASPDEPLPNLPGKEMYAEMMKEVNEPTTILYLHGGAYYLCDPSTHRATVKRLAKLTKGRAYSVRYRLAPQHPFPAALLDAFVSYLTLLYPPPGAWHEPVKPEHIVIAGDSAGGNLVLALLQLVLQFRRTDTKVTWHGVSCEIPLPVAITCNSPWLDITQSSPSWEGDVADPWDYLPKPAMMAKSNLKQCPIWPVDPPRQHLYVDDDLAAHPLASLVMSKSWKGAPPIYICTGWEILAFEDKWLAKQLDTEGVKVVFEEYEAMPHCFAAILDKTPNATRCYNSWAGFIKQAIADETQIESRAVNISARDLLETELDFQKLSDITDEEIRTRVELKAEMREAAAKL